MQPYFHDKPGSAPGTLVFESEAPAAIVNLLDYDRDRSVFLENIPPEKCKPYLETPSVSWVHVCGLGNEVFWQHIGEVFDLHPLLLEDVVNVPQRPKVEEYDDRLLIVARQVEVTETGFDSQQVSLVLGPQFLMLVCERDTGGGFELVRDQIRAQKGAICARGADYLAYALLDAIIDGFFPVLERYGDRIERLEEEIISDPSPKTLKKVYRVRRELLNLRRTIWPQRSAINSLERNRSDLVSRDVEIYLRDCYDHAIQVLDTIETYRELASSLMDVYLSSVSNKMNEVMKILTVISTIFIPLTFVAGVYGMNFNPDASPWNMPELNWAWGYPICLGAMLAIACGLIIFFWKKGWFETISGLEEDSHQ